MSEWPEISKAVVNTSDNIKEIGFNVWSNLTLESNADDVHPVYGEDGTIVSHQNGLWKCTNEQSWYKGYYEFAAALPPSLFSGSYSNSTLTLNTGSDGYDLASRQDDLMYAFSNVDNSNGDASVVNMVFNHAFALLDIRIQSGAPFASQSIYGTKLTLYGIHRKMIGQLNITVSNESETSTNLNEILAEKTTEESPYYYLPYTATQGFNYGSNTISFFPNKLLVFPEDLEESPLTITIGLNRSGQEVLISHTISEGEWAPGSTNVYIFSI